MACGGGGGGGGFGVGVDPGGAGGSAADQSALVAKGKQIFRFDTFGDEAHWTGTLRMHEVIGTVSPVTALAVGLKVDAEALPPDVTQGIRDGSVDLKSPPRRWPC